MIPLKIPAHFFILIILIGTVGMLATDIYLPGVPEMTEIFQCTQSEIQGSFTVFLLGLAVCQLIYGGLCDFIGQRRVMIYALIIFIGSSILCAQAKTLDQFLLFRVLQAIGSAAGSVVSRSIISSRYDKTAAVRIFSTTFPIVGLSAAIAPLIGGYLIYLFHWKATFYFMACYGIFALLMVMKYMKPDTILANTNLKSLSGSSLGSSLEAVHQNTLSRYFKVLLNRHFIGYALIICAGFSAFRSYTAESPFVFDQHGYGPEEIGCFYVALSAAYLMGNLLAKKLLHHMSVEKILSVGFCFYGLGGGLFLLGARFVGLTPYAMIIPMALITLGNGLLFPTGSASALASVPTRYSGIASGLVGALQFFCAALCIHCIGDICQGYAPALSIFIGAILLVGFLSFGMILMRRGLVPTPQDMDGEPT